MLQTLIDFALLCPGVLLLGMSLVMVMVRDKNASQKLLLCTAVVFSVYFLADGLYLSPHHNYQAMVVLNVVKQFVGPCILPLLVIYYRMLSGKKPLHWNLAIWFVVIIAHGSMCLMLFLLLGRTEGARFIEALFTNQDLSAFSAPIYKLNYSVAVTQHNIILMAEIVYTLINAINTMRLNRFKPSEVVAVIYGRSARRLALLMPLTILMMGVCGVRRTLGDIYLEDNVGVAAVLSILAAVVGLAIAYYGIRNVNSVDAVMLAAPDSDEEAPLTDNDRSAIRNSTPANYVEKLYNSFMEAMDERKMYLDPSISIDSMAAELCTNRTYISKMINLRLGMNFRQYINRRRIEDAKLLMLKNPDAVIEYISASVGYLSASVFIKKFQQYEGTSPRQWALIQRGGE